MSTPKTIEEMREEFGQSDIALRGHENCTPKEIADWWIAKIEADRKEQGKRIVELLEGALKGESLGGTTVFKLKQITESLSPSTNEEPK